jgi:hypothetical protein
MTTNVTITPIPMIRWCANTAAGDTCRRTNSGRCPRKYRWNPTECGMQWQQKCTKAKYDSNNDSAPTGRRWSGCGCKCRRARMVEETPTRWHLYLYTRKWRNEKLDRQHQHTNQDYIETVSGTNTNQEFQCDQSETVPTNQRRCRCCYSCYRMMLVQLVRRLDVETFLSPGYIRNGNEPARTAEVPYNGDVCEPRYKAYMPMESKYKCYDS